MKRIVLLLIFVISIIGCTAPEKESNGNLGVIEVPQVETIDEPQTIEDKDTDISPIEDIVKEVKNITDEIKDDVPVIADTNTSKNATNSSDKLYQNSRCSDSDATSEFPNGINLGVKGTILVNGKPIKGGVDVCTTTVKVSEWYCQNGVPRVQVYQCPGSCSDAACLSVQ